jgi:hypothetical protein
VIREGREVGTHSVRFREEAGLLRAVSEDELRQAIPVLQKVRAALDAARD